MSEDRKYYGFRLFHNDRRSNDRQPEYKGDGDSDGALSPEVVAYIAECHALGETPKLEVVGWLKTGKSGNKYQSLSIGIHWQVKKDREAGGVRTPRAEPRREAPRSRAPSLPGMGDLDDDVIPF